MVFAWIWLHLNFDHRYTTETYPWWSSSKLCSVSFSLIQYEVLTFERLMYAICGPIALKRASLCNHIIVSISFQQVSDKYMIIYYSPLISSTIVYLLMKDSAMQWKFDPRCSHCNAMTGRWSALFVTLTWIFQGGQIHIRLQYEKNENIVYFFYTEIDNWSRYNLLYITCRCLHVTWHHADKGLP